MLDTCHSHYLRFQKHLVNTLNKQAPKKPKIIQGNNKSHINKTLRKTNEKIATENQNK